MLNHLRNAIAGAAVTIIIYTLTRLPIPEIYEGNYTNDYCDPTPEPTPKPYLITEEDHINDLL